MRLIDADEVVQRILGYRNDDPFPGDWDSSCAYKMGCEDAIGCVEECATISIVRCKDCKHYKPQNQSVRWKHITNYCMRSAAIKVGYNDFCSFGVRRDEDERN